MLSIALYSLIGLLLLITLLIVIGTLQSGISPMPSSSKAYHAVQDFLKKSPSQDIVDLGSGWGHVVVKLAKDFPEKQIHGYEISFLPWLISVGMKRLYGLDNLTLHRSNFLTTQWPEECTLVCYLFPEVMQKVAAKLKEQRVKQLVSNNFALPNHTPIRKEVIRDFYRSPVYLYDFK